MKEVLNFLYPLCAALIASFITYLLTIRGKKHDILLQERIKAFKTISRELSLLKRYCSAVLATYNGNDFEPRVEDLAAVVQKSALLNWTSLQNLIDENSIFLSSKSKLLINEIFTNLSILANIEQLLASTEKDFSIINSAPKEYSSTISKIDILVDNLYKELRLPNKLF